MSEEDIPQGVKDRLATMATARNEATAQATAATAKATAAEAQVAELTEKLKGADALTASNLDLQEKLTASDTRYTQLSGMVDAGFTSSDDRDLAEFYHGKAGGSGTLVDYAKGLSADNAPKGLAHLFTGTAAKVEATTEATTEATSDAAKLTNTTGTTTVTTPVAQGQTSPAQIHAMTTAEFIEYKKTAEYQRRFAG